MVQVSVLGDPLLVSECSAGLCFRIFEFRVRLIGLTFRHLWASCGRFQDSLPHSLSSCNLPFCGGFRRQATSRKANNSTVLTTVKGTRLVASYGFVWVSTEFPQAFPVPWLPGMGRLAGTHQRNRDILHKPWAWLVWGRAKAARNDHSPTYLSAKEQN